MKKREHSEKLKKFDLVMKSSDGSEKPGVCLDFSSDKFRDTDAVKRIGCLNMVHSSNCC
jgi:hypothetical protein